MTIRKTIMMNMHKCQPTQHGTLMINDDYDDYGDYNNDNDDVDDYKDNDDGDDYNDDDGDYYTPVQAHPAFQTWQRKSILGGLSPGHCTTHSPP